MAGRIKTIGVLTSGGDAPGMNAAIRAVCRTAINMGMRVMGIRRGYNGLITGDMFEMNIRSVSEIIHRGGTVLYTARCMEFTTPEGQEKAKNVCIENGVDAIVAIGGDGTFRGALDLSKRGVACIGIPGTIDNDVGASEYTIGYDTALNTAMEMVDKLRDTTQSHDRCSVVEVMGHRAGYLAANTGIACGAVCILVPEIPFDLEHDVISRMKRTQKTGKKHFIVVVAEGCGSAIDISKVIQEKTGIETKATVLGHVQRGGTPTMRDRVVASEMGFHAVELLNEGITNRLVVMQQGLITDVDIVEGLAMKKEINQKLMVMSQTISI
ncbi:MAG: 6-phosphofructokinase [Oscillospiraceae bacterium]|nr:6-phosphofructokinase [Oscillospiraceae bacterium]